MIKFMMKRNNTGESANDIKSLFWEFDVLSVVGDEIGFTVAINTDLSLDELLDKVDTFITIL